MFRIKRKILTYEDEGDDEDGDSFINRNEASVRAGKMPLKDGGTFITSRIIIIIVAR